MDSIIFSLSKVPDAITDKTVYTAHVQTNGTLGRDELAERLAARRQAARVQLRARGIAADLRHRPFVRL